VTNCYLLCLLLPGACDLYSVLSDGPHLRFWPLTHLLLGVVSTAYIFSDRLEIRPSKAWQQFLSHGELLPKALDRSVQLHLRKRQGPGRLSGRKVLMVGKIRLVISLFELDSDTNSHELRVVLYETRHSQTAEYRLSSMERLMLFSDDKPILEQICARLRHVYCDVTDKSRTLLVLDDDDVPRFEASFEVDGDEEYEVHSQASDSGKHLFCGMRIVTCPIVLLVSTGLMSSATHI
jgi:hypothetical protein